MDFITGQTVWAQTVRTEQTDIYEYANPRPLRVVEASRAAICLVDSTNNEWFFDKKDAAELIWGSEHDFLLKKTEWLQKRIEKSRIKLAELSGTLEQLNKNQNL